MKKTNTKSDVNWFTIVAVIVIMLIIELLGNYCNTHAEEHRQKDWERFEKRMKEVHYMNKWDK